MANTYKISMQDGEAIKRNQLVILGIVLKLLDKSRLFELFKEIWKNRTKNNFSDENVPK